MEMPARIAVRSIPKVNNNDGSIEDLCTRKRFNQLDHACRQLPDSHSMVLLNHANQGGLTGDNIRPDRRFCDGVADGNESVAWFERSSPLTVRAPLAQAQHCRIRFQPVNPAGPPYDERCLMTRIDIAQLFSAGRY